jgi:hypothetical protein
MAANRMPAADVGVSAELVRCLLADQHPDLARLPVEFLANGWGNELYQVGDGLIARLPRRALGAHIIEHEQRWLPRLAPRLPLPIPHAGTDRDTRLRLSLSMERGAVPAGRARGAGHVLRPGGSQAPPPAGPDDKPPADPGLIPLTVHEVKRLLAGVDSSILSLTTHRDQAIQPLTCRKTVFIDHVAMTAHARLRPLTTAAHHPILHVGCTAHGFVGG